MTKETYEQKLAARAMKFISTHPTFAEEISRQFSERNGTKPHRVMEVAMTKRQKDVFDFICKYYQKNEGVSPSFDEIKDGVGFASKSSIHRIIVALEARGLIQRLEGMARTIAPRYAA